MEILESKDFQIYLEPTTFIDSNSPNIIEFARSSVGDAKTSIEKAVRIFYAVRDEIRYDPYHIDISRDWFRASVVLANKSGFCVEKALLLAAAARVVGIPSRLRFADVRNHLTTEQLKKLMKTDLFIFHGYTELYLNNKWVKATPTFNRSLCERFGVNPIDFDGVNDSIFHEFDAKGKKHMEYVNDHGHFADLPYETIIASYQKHYPLYFAEKRNIPKDEFEKEALEESSHTS
ncbi:MAG: transglutaminase family protein [Deltaproteobacteria bacterium]|nr:transglutaminase family protein [Deltaproteobacteria bacterium]